MLIYIYTHDNAQVSRNSQPDMSACHVKAYFRSQAQTNCLNGSEVFRWENEERMNGFQYKYERRRLGANNG